MRWSLAGLAILAAACATGNPPTAPTEFGVGERAVAQAVARTWKSLLRVHQQAAPAALGATAQGVEDLVCGVVVRYFNAQGQEQAEYDQVTTARVTAKGTCAGSGITTTVDLTLDDMQWSRPSFLANGTTLGTYDGLSVHGEAKNLRVPRQPCAYPTGGELVARVQGISITVIFNGTATATATYSRAGENVSFAIPLEGC